MLTLIKTLIDITMLRKGPDALPPAWLVFYLTLGLWLVGVFFMAAVVPGLQMGDLVSDIVGWGLSIALFAVVILGMGYRHRLAQGLSAISGSGTVILYAQIIVTGFFLALGAPDVAVILFELLLMWAVFVMGRIVAATVNVHPIVGVAISVVVYVLRYLSSVAMA